MSEHELKLPTDFAVHVNQCGGEEVRGKYYIHRMGENRATGKARSQYLHKDGSVHPTAFVGNEATGYYATREEAQDVLDAWRGKAAG